MTDLKFHWFLPTNGGDGRQIESEGQRRMLALNGGTTDGLEIHPNLWAGVGLVRGGAGTAFVGSHRQIADLIEQYVDVGISEFVLSGYPHLEEGAARVDVTRVVASSGARPRVGAGGPVRGGALPGGGVMRRFDRRRSMRSGSRPQNHTPWSVVDGKRDPGGRHDRRLRKERAVRLHDRSSNSDLAQIAGPASVLVDRRRSIGRGSRAGTRTSWSVVDRTRGQNTRRNEEST